MVGWRGRLDANAKEEAAAAEIGGSRVVESVAFEDAATWGATKVAEFADERRDVRDAKLDFDFWSCAGDGCHGWIIADRNDVSNARGADDTNRRKTRERLIFWLATRLGFLGVRFHSQNKKLHSQNGSVDSNFVIH